MKNLVFLNIEVYNETSKHIMYMLTYKAERGNYNFTLVTMIFTDTETGKYRYFLTEINMHPKVKELDLLVI